HRRVAVVLMRLRRDPVNGAVDGCRQGVVGGQESRAQLAPGDRLGTGGHTAKTQVTGNGDGRIEEIHRLRRGLDQGALVFPYLVEVGDELVAAGAVEVLEQRVGSAAHDPGIAAEELVDVSNV